MKETPLEKLGEFQRLILYHDFPEVSKRDTDDPRAKIYSNHRPSEFGDDLHEGSFGHVELCCQVSSKII